MVPPDFNARNLEPRGSVQVRYTSSSIEAALGSLASLCGIYEWKAELEGTRPDQPINAVLYVGGTCVHREPQNWRAESLDTANCGRNHKKDRSHK